MLVEGSPAAIRGYNHVAMSRLGWNESELEAVKDAYKRIFRAKGGSMEDKIAKLVRDYPASKAVRKIVESVRETSDGLNGRSLESHRTDNKRATRVVKG
jgi:UDP-N-acetylglucosamine acyltransferase